MNEKESSFYIQLSPLSILEIFKKYKILIPRSIRIEVLRKVAEPYLNKEKVQLQKKHTETKNLFSDKDADRLKRLQNYSSFSEIQFENAIEYYDDKGLNQAYYELLWKNIVHHLNEASQTQALKDLNHLSPDDKIMHQSVLAYNHIFDPFFVDSDDQIDGSPIHLVKNHFESTSTKKEVKKLAVKYGVVIPASSSKVFLRSKLEIILKENHKYTDEMMSKINNGTVQNLKDILKQFNLEPQDLLSIGEMMDIIIAGIQEKRKLAIKQTVVVHDNPKVIAPVPLESLLQQILINQQLILQNLENFNDGIKVDNKKKKMDKIYNYVVISLIVIVVIIWIVYAITTMFN